MPTRNARRGRSPNGFIEAFAVRDMLRQRVHGLALGWDDLSDLVALRRDVAMEAANLTAPDTVDALMARAGAAMYHSKAKGRNQVVLG